MAIMYRNYCIAKIYVFSLKCNAQYLKINFSKIKVFNEKEIILILKSRKPFYYESITLFNYNSFPKNIFLCMCLVTIQHVGVVRSHVLIVCFCECSL